MKSKSQHLIHRQSLWAVARRCFSCRPRLLLVALFALCGVIGANADYTQPFSSDGYYFMLDLGKKKATVVYDLSYTGKQLVDIPAYVRYNGNDYSVSNISAGAFKNCTKIKTVILPETMAFWDNHAFDGCTGVTTLHFNSELNATFLNLWEFENLEVLHLNTRSSFGTTWFHDKKTIRELHYHGTYNIVSKNEFEGFTNLKKIVFYSTSLETISKQAFKGCGNLEECTVQSSLKTIGDEAFMDCGKLKAFPLGTTKVETIGKSAFHNCSSLYFTSPFPNTLTTIGDYAFANSGVKTVNLRQTAITSIGKGVFMDCKSLIQFTDPDELKTIGEEAFRGCILLRDVGLQGSGVTSIGRLAYHGCTNLSTVSLPTSLENIDDFAFSSSGVTKVKGLDKTKLVYIASAVFQNCTKLTSIDLPENLSQIQAAAFENSGLTSIILPEGVGTIGASAFRGTNITSIEFPDDLTTIKTNAFTDCKKLTRVSFGKYMGSGNPIGFRAFYGCDALKTIYTTSEAPIKLDYEVFSPNVTPDMRDSILIDYRLYDGYKKQRWEQYFNFKFPKATGLSVSPLLFGTYVGSSPNQMTATVTPASADQSVTWLSDNVSVASVDANGLVTPLKAGKANIIALHKSGLSAKCSYSVKDVEMISLSPSGVTVEVGGSRLIKANVLPYGLTPSLTWKSDNPQVAAVIGGTQGNIVGQKIGTATITATAPNGVKGTCRVIVTQAGIDINRDGEVNSADIVALYNYILEDTSGGTNISNFDTNKDGEVNSADIVALYNYILNGE